MRKEVIICTILVFLALGFFSGYLSAKLKNERAIEKTFNSQGWDLLNLGISEEASAYFEKYVGIDKNNFAAQMGLGGSYNDLGLYEKSIVAFEKASALNPQSAIPYRGLGLDYYFLEDYENAAKYFEAAAERDPTDIEVWDWIGQSYLMLNYPENAWSAEFEKWKSHQDRAEIAFLQALSIDPNHTPSLLGMGKVLFKKAQRSGLIGDYEEAKSYYEKVIRNLYKLDVANADLGWVLLEMEKLKPIEERNLSRSISLFSQSIALRPKSWNSYLGLGLSYMYAGDYDQSLKNIDAAITLNPKSSFAHSSKGLALYFASYLGGRDSYDEAISAFQTAMGMDSSGPYPYNGLGWSYYRMGDKVKAREYFIEGSSHFPGFMYLELGLNLTEIS